MIDHYIQKQIVTRLAFQDALNFSSLKPESVENKLFDYHLKKVLTAGLARKQDDGNYALTPEGKRVALHIAEANTGFAHSAQAVLFLAVKKNDAWLLYNRKTQPLLGMKGFMHATPNPEESAIEAAKKQLFAKTGLQADFRISASGYTRLYKRAELESFTAFTLLFADNPTGELKSNDERAEYGWEANPDFKADDMLPHMPALVEACSSASIEFIEESYEL